VTKVTNIINRVFFLAHTPNSSQRLITGKANPSTFFLQNLHRLPPTFFLPFFFFFSPLPCTPPVSNLGDHGLPPPFSPPTSSSLQVYSSTLHRILSLSAQGLEYGRCDYHVDWYWYSSTGTERVQYAQVCVCGETE